MAEPSLGHSAKKVCVRVLVYIATDGHVWDKDSLFSTCTKHYSTGVLDQESDASKLQGWAAVAEAQAAQLA